MAKSDAYDAAIAIAIASLKSIDLNARCAAVGLDPLEDGLLRTRMFGTNLVFRSELVLAKAG